MDRCLIYGISDLKLVGCIDPSFKSDRDDDKNVSGLMFTLNRGAICWKGFRQATVLDSICKVEYITASNTVKGATGLQKFLGELGVAPSLDGPVLVFCDNIRAIAQAKELRSHHRAKHVLSRYQLIREIIK